MRQSEPLPFNDVMEVNAVSCVIMISLSCDILQMYVRSFRRVYEEEIRCFMVEVKASLGGAVEARKKFLPKVNTETVTGDCLALISLCVKVTSNADLMRNSPLGGSLLSMPPAKDRAGLSQSVADFSTSGAFGTGDTARPRWVR